MSSSRARLRQELTDYLVPALFKAGFEGPGEIGGNQLVHQYSRADENGTQVLELQLEKRQLPRFAINLYVEPPEGIERIVTDGGMVIQGRLTSGAGPTTRAWFRADPPWWRRILGSVSSSPEREAVTECLALLPEVEEWWSTQTSSRHIRTQEVTYPGRQTAPPGDMR